jgi:NADH-quinone oxidoreductase subunit A
MLRSYLPVLVFAGLGALLGITLVALNALVGPRRPNPVKRQPYECGLPSEFSHNFRFGVSFYLVAMMFILFDIEVVLLFPVATILSETQSVYALVAIVLFIFFLAVAWIYEVARGSLDWR